MGQANNIPKLLGPTKYSLKQRYCLPFVLNIVGAESMPPETKFLRFKCSIFWAEKNALRMH